MALIGIDIGTTHCKAGIFGLDGRVLAVSSQPNQVQHSSTNVSFHYTFYDPEGLWNLVVGLLVDVLAQLPVGEVVQALGIASMAETGLLLDRRNGLARSPLLPWFDPLASAQADELRQQVSAGPAQRQVEYFCSSGVRPTYKCGLAKLLWLKRQGVELHDGVWLSAADYVAYRLSGNLATDYSLAVRTCAFQLVEKTWNMALLRKLDLDETIFPALYPGGNCVGGVKSGVQIGDLPEGTPVAVAGHDHICAAFAAAALSGGLCSDLAFDSIGTAESLVGAFPERFLETSDWQAGFSYGLHTWPGYLYWAGGLSTSGGSIEWLRHLLGVSHSKAALSYADLDALLDGIGSDPGRLLFFPYLAGSGAPHSDPQVRGTFLGLEAAHGPADLYRAVLEGTTYEMEFARRKAEQIMGQPVRRIVAAGGGTRNRRWMQLRADIFGCPVTVLPQTEATTLGAALLAGVGCGIYSDLAHMARNVSHLPDDGAVYAPDPQRHAAYRQVYEERFLALQEVVRAASRTG